MNHNLRFPGQYFDAETGLNYNYFRDYNPLVGRYLQRDIYGIIKGTNHLYLYVKNNPFIMIDIFGLKCSVVGTSTKSWHENSEEIIYGNWIFDHFLQLNVGCVCIYHRDKRIDVTTKIFTVTDNYLECVDVDKCGKKYRYFDTFANVNTEIKKISKYGGRDIESRRGWIITRRADVESGGGCDCEPTYPRPPGIYNN